MNMIDQEIRKALARALKKAQKSGALPAFDLPDDIPVERPKQEEMGDFASPVCMQLARLARMAPVKIAEAVVANLPLCRSSVTSRSPIRGSSTLL